MVKWYASDAVLRSADLPSALNRACRRLLSTGSDQRGFEASSVVCLLASDVIDGRGLPRWVDAETRFLVVLDVPLGLVTAV